MRTIRVAGAIVGVTVAITLALTVYRVGAVVMEVLEAEGWLRWLARVIGIAPIVVTWYVISMLALKLRSQQIAVERARTDFTPTERGFAPRLIEGKVINPNVVPSAVTLLDAAESPEEISEERRLAGVMGWHLSNAPVQREIRQSGRVALPIPKPEPAPWEISHVERLLIEAGEIGEGDAE